jgi:hypothetical protein
MWIRLHPPFGGRKTSNGKIWDELNLSEPVGVEEFLKQLAQRFPELGRHIRPSGEETFHHFLLLRAGEVLNETDQIRPDDRIEIMMPLTGG